MPATAVRERFYATIPVLSFQTNGLKRPKHHKTPRPSKSETVDIMILEGSCQAARTYFLDRRSLFADNPG